MPIVSNNKGVWVVHGDSLTELRSLKDDSIDSIVTDPPYGLSNTDPKHVAETLTKWVTGDHEYTPPVKGGGFMGKTWDSFVPPPAVWNECMRVLKPGGHLLVFAGSRTQDLMGMSIRLAGFELRDSLAWIYGSGFPKSMDISKAIDKSTGENRNRQFEFTEWMRSTGITVKQISEATGTATMGGHYLAISSQPAIATADLFDKLRPMLPEVPERIERLVAERTGIEWTDYVKREVTQAATRDLVQGDAISFDQRSSSERERRDIPASDAAREWEGWGTALKPAQEPIILARKPLDGTVAANVLAHGVGGLNIDACRVGISDEDRAVVDSRSGVSEKRNSMFGVGQRVEDGVWKSEPSGRWPANVLLDPEAAAAMDQQSGVLKSGVGKIGAGKGSADNASSIASTGKIASSYGDSGGASRFFPVFKYQAKAPKKERPVIEREDGTKVQHPTVKPLTLMEWLVTLVTPPGGVVLDPFAGSGTTAEAAINEGFRCVAIEGSEEYLPLINARIERAEPPQK